MQSWPVISSFMVEWRGCTISQACKLKFRLRELTSCLCSTAASYVCFVGRVAGLDATETGNELSQPKFELTSLTVLRSAPFQQIQHQIWMTEREGDTDMILWDWEGKTMPPKRPAQSMATMPLMQCHLSVAYIALSQAPYWNLETYDQNIYG